MAETAMSVARDHLFPCLKEAFNLIRGLPKEVADMKDELERIQAFIHDAADEDNTPDRIKRKMKELIEIAFRTEDVIGEYMIYEEQQNRDDAAGCAAICEAVDYIKTMIPRLQIAYKMKDIKSRVCEIKESCGIADGFQIQSFQKQGASSSAGNKNVLSQNVREEAPLCMDKADIVGFEAPANESVGWLLKGRAHRTALSVVAMGGQGKTTLAKKVFDNEEVIAHFNSHAWFTVSQSYTIEGLLKDMLGEFCKEKKEREKEEYLKKISTMNQQSLKAEVRNYLQQKRYVLVFDDVWDQLFWDQIEYAVIDNKNGSRILITTRNMGVVESCKKSSFVEIHELKSLPPKESWKLFCKKAFQFECDGCCPKDLEHISSEIVEKCEGLPLALVVIGGLLSSKAKTISEWEEFNKYLSLELQKNQHLTGITKILGFSYIALPYHLKSCILYLGIYPEDYEIKCKRLIRQWIAEGFVKDEGKPLEKVAEQYLKELINRSLVQVSSLTIDGRVRSCRVHDLTREMILKKIKDLCFCHSAHDNLESNGISRRLTITTSSNDFKNSIESSHIQSLFFFTETKIPEHLVRRIGTKYRSLKALDFQGSRLDCVPTYFRNLIQLKYLNLRGTHIRNLPNSIAMLQNLETLDVRETLVEEMPKEISKLRKLRYLMGSRFVLKGDIGGMASLQTLYTVLIYKEVGRIRELGRLTQLRKLRLVEVSEEEGSTIWSSINKMQHLETLHIDSYWFDDILGSQFDSPPSMLRELSLRSSSSELPKWVPELHKLVKLTLIFFHFTDDPLKSLKDLPNLLFLCLDCCKGESLHFQEGRFQKLKQLKLMFLYELKSLCFDQGALLSLKFLSLRSIHKLEEVPSGIQHLQELEALDVDYMSLKFEENLAPIRGPEHPAIQHVPLVRIRSFETEDRTIHHSTR